MDHDAEQQHWDMESEAWGERSCFCVAAGLACKEGGGCGNK